MLRPELTVRYWVEQRIGATEVLAPNVESIPEQPRVTASP